MTTPYFKKWNGPSSQCFSICMICLFWLTSVANTAIKSRYWATLNLVPRQEKVCRDLLNIGLLSIPFGRGIKVTATLDLSVYWLIFHYKTNNKCIIFTIKAVLSTKEAVFSIARRGSSVQSGISMNTTLQYDQYPFNPLQNQSIDDACHSTVMYQEAF